MEDLRKYRVQLRYYLQVSGVAVTAEDRVCCVQRGHADTEFHARLEENGDSGDRLVCETCGTADDIFNVEGYLSGLENSRSTFPRRVEEVVRKLAIVLPEPTAGIDKPAADMTDEELRAVKVAQIEAGKKTRKASDEAKAVKRSADRQREEQEAGEITRVAPFRILGRADDGQFYFESYQGHIETLRLGTGITKEQLYLLGPMSWWENEFNGGRSRIDMDSAKFYLIAESNKVSFSTARLRGRGCWRED